MRFLIDEMFPSRTCAELQDRGHDAIHVRDRGLDACPDSEVAALALAEDRVLVTENVKDFAHVAGLTVLCVLKARLTARAMAPALADLVHSWSVSNLEPYRGLHWPV